jgi:tetratricopeptide (TPR) repeat protein
LTNSLSIHFFFMLIIFAAARAATGQAPAHAATSTDAPLIRQRGLASIDKGSVAEADSLLRIADTAGILSAGDYLRWLDAKAVLSNYADAAGLCCKIDAREPRFSAVARGRLTQMTEEQPVAAKREALDAYRRCALPNPGCDTLLLKQWLSRAYASCGLFAQQDSLLVQLDTKQFPSAQDFLDAAEERFSRGFVSEAVFPATRAWARLADADTAARSLAATMLFQCYRTALRPDSASYWLSRASLSDERFRISAVAFLQSAGMPDRADSLMTGIRPSFARDTLMIRRLLYAGDPKGAYARSAGVTRPRDAAVLWKARTALFSDNAADLDGWIDTVSFSPSSSAGEEMLTYRYRLSVLASSAASAPQALRDFGTIAYALWCGKPDKASSVGLSSYPRPVREMLTCDIVRAYARTKRFDSARAAAEAVGLDSAGGELRYYYADVCIQQGYFDKGAAVLEQLMLADPNNVFSGRARLLLGSLKKKNR